MKTLIKYGECHCGCGSKTNLASKSDKCNGNIKGTPIRFIKGHENRRGPVDYLIDKNDCWIWQRHIINAGYGQKGHNGKVMLAHRYYYEKYKGKIPKGLVLDHLCFVRACVNPDHLEAVTQSENNIRAGARKTHCPHGHEYTEDNIYRYPNLPFRRRCRKCRSNIRRKRYLNHGD